MFLKSLAFQDLHTGWSVQRTVFERFNLLVGNSGVGKTKILRSLLDVASLAFSERSVLVEYQFDGLTWDLEFLIDDQAYRWSGRAKWTMEDSFELETLHRGDTPIFTRDAEKFIFRGHPLPLLNPQLSGLRLLAGE